MIHVALTSAYTTEADARRGLVTMPDDTPYLGVWHAPTHERPEVHVFSEEADTDDLAHANWIRA